MKKNVKNILCGVILILIGLLIACNELKITNINIFFDGWWTLFIIIPCFVNLFDDDDKTGSIVGLLIGVILLLSCQGLINFDLIWKLLLPAILIIIGVSIMYKNIFTKKIEEKIKKKSKSKIDDTNCCATFSSQKIKIEKEKIESGNLDAIFGGIELDLREAKITNDIVINATCIFGGIDIFVPDDVKIIIKSTCIFGGADNKKKNKVDDDKAHTIYINATCIFGGIDIK